MTEREKLQACYELTFFPPRSNEAWDRIKKGSASEVNELGELLDTALLLHQALPEKGFASQRALNRLALYQSRARAFGMVGFIRRLRRRLLRPPLAAREVPGHLVRDIGLPPLARHIQKNLEKFIKIGHGSKFSGSRVADSLKFFNREPF